MMPIMMEFLTRQMKVHLAAGEYIIRGQFHSLWMQTFSMQPNFHSVQIISGENFTDVNFGYRMNGAFILSTLPSQNGIHIAPQSNIAALFSQAIDVTTLNTATILLYGTQSGLHTSNIMYDNVSHTVVLDPLQNFQAGENVSAIFRRSILTTNGVAMEKSFL